MHLLAKTNSRRELYTISVLAALTLYFGEYSIYLMPKIYRCHLHEVRSEAMDNCTQCKAAFPGGSQVCDVNVTVPFCLFLTPGQYLKDLLVKSQVFVIRVGFLLSINGHK